MKIIVREDGFDLIVLPLETVSSVVLPGLLKQMLFKALCWTRLLSFQMQPVCVGVQEIWPKNETMKF